MHSPITCWSFVLVLAAATARGEDRAGELHRGRPTYLRCPVCGLPRPARRGQPIGIVPTPQANCPRRRTTVKGIPGSTRTQCSITSSGIGWRDPYNKTQRLTMPAFGQTLAPGEIHDVIEYLKTMWTPRPDEVPAGRKPAGTFPARSALTPPCTDSPTHTTTKDFKMRYVKILLTCSRLRPVARDGGGHSRSSSTRIRIATAATSTPGILKRTASRWR